MKLTQQNSDGCKHSEKFQGTEQSEEHEEENDCTTEIDGAEECLIGSPDVVRLQDEPDEEKKVDEKVDNIEPLHSL